MGAINRREVKTTGVHLTEIGLGGAPLGSMRTLVSEEDATATLAAAWESGIRYFDTAPWYGRGLSERRFGTFLAGKPRDQFVISTKVGRLLQPLTDPKHFDPAPWAGSLPFDTAFDYTYDGIMRAFEDSLQRLGLPSIDLLLVHDLDSGYHRPAEKLDAYWAQLATSGWRALQHLRDSHTVRGIGAGINYVGLIPRFLDNFDVDLFLLASPYTLLDQGALESELPLCVERNVGIVIGAVFNSGILATGATDHAQYNYSDADSAVVHKVRRIQSVCEQYATSVRAAALQFPLAHPAVVSVIPGAFAPEQVQQNVQEFQKAIPDDLWGELKQQGLIAEGAPTPRVAVKR